MWVLWVPYSVLTQMTGWHPAQTNPCHLFTKVIVSEKQLGKKTA